jgi:colanic acid/amylovoran biosynthesis glycosyltransferase
MKLKIAFLVNDFPSLTETFIQSQIIGVLEAGYEVIIFAGKVKYDLTIPEELQKFDLLKRTVSLTLPSNRFYQFGKRLKYLFENIRKYPVQICKALNVFRFGRTAGSLSLVHQVILFMENGPFDLIHCQFGPLGVRGLHIKEVISNQIKLVTSFRGFDATKTLSKRPDCYRELFKKGDLFLPVSNSLKNRIIESGCDNAKIIILPSGIDCQKFKFATRSVEPGNPVKIITIARLVEKKGVAYGIDAVGQVIKAGRNVDYLIIGDGELRQDLERKILYNGLQKHVHLLGWKSHERVIQYLEESHILIAPSITGKDGDQEGIPNVIKEGMALGLPVIGTYHSGIPELILDGVSGLLVKERNTEDLSEKLCYLIDNPEIWPTMGKAGREQVEKLYDLKFLNSRLLKIYQGLFERH